MRKLEFARGVRHRLEADERPRRERDYRDHLRKRTLAGRERGGEGGEPALVIRHDEAEADEYAGYQHEREHYLHPRREALPFRADEAEDHQRRRREQHFAEVDVVAEYRVVESELERIAEKVSRDQRKRRRVRPDYRNVRQHEEPRAEEAVVEAEGLFRVGISAARVGVAIHHVVVVRADDEHHRRADEYAERGAERTRYRQKGRAGHDERAPADAAAEGERPNSHRGEISVESFALDFRSHILLLPSAAERSGE